MRHTRLSEAAYELSKFVGTPRTIAVACWSKAEWPGIAHDRDGVYATSGLFMDDMPHWVHLSPGTCRSLETLLHHRPKFPNVYTADALETLTHEVMHAVGIDGEAEAECIGMQLSAFMAGMLGVPERYSIRLSALDLENYAGLPPGYIDRKRCREDGEWDLVKGQNSPPWHGNLAYRRSDSPGQTRPRRIVPGN
jgi:hypothetical protein